MTEYHQDFFDEERPWSRLKNQILSSYMVPYLSKVRKLGKRIVLVDAFAGRGKMANNEDGSPLIICKAAEKYAQGNYTAILVNNDEKHHAELTATLRASNYASNVIPVLGNATELIQKLVEILEDQTLFLYLDPFGLDCEFDTLRPLLRRDKRFSSEILINLHMPIIHRLASRNAIQDGNVDRAKITRFHAKLSRTLGGEYWRDILLCDDERTPKEREVDLVKGYLERLSRTGYLTYTGSCPVRNREESQTKYFMAFASRHLDSMLLFNDEMCKLFNRFMHEQDFKDTMFADMPWSSWRDRGAMEATIVEYLSRYEDDTRQELWHRIIQDHFMRFTRSEYRKTLKSLVDSGRVLCTTPIQKGGTRPTKALNNHCRFKLPPQKELF